MLCEEVHKSDVKEIFDAADEKYANKISLFYKKYNFELFQNVFCTVLVMLSFI